MEQQEFASRLLALCPPEWALSPARAAQMAAHWQLLAEANQKQNLTAIREAEPALSLHYLDSLLLAADIPPQARLLDIGSGAGFPGMPLAIARPDCSVMLLEASAKRCAFLRQSVAALGLQNVEICEARAEKAGHDAALRESFDCVTARAVTALPALAEYCLPFLRLGGLFLAMKGPAYAEELAAAEAALAILGGEYLGCREAALPQGEQRRILRIRKNAPCPEKYPRREGMPEKKPLSPRFM